MARLKVIALVAGIGLALHSVIGAQGKNLEGAAEVSKNISPSSIAWKKKYPFWFAREEPFKIIGPVTGGVYFVGTQGLAVFFIPTSKGHIVIDGGMPGQGLYIANAIRSLGFDPTDIKVLLNSHAHLDHSGGLAELKTLSGAQLIASEGDRSALEGGFYLGSEDNSNLNAPPVKVDQLIGNKETFEHGGVTLTAYITPGHTRGCTSWVLNVKQGDNDYEALFFCSATVAGNRLIGPAQYNGIVDDYRRTFSITRDWKPDVFLANHPQFFGFKAKRTAQLAGNPLAFVDANEFPRFIQRMAFEFEAKLMKQQLEYNAFKRK